MAFEPAAGDEKAARRPPGLTLDDRFVGLAHVECPKLLVGMRSAAPFMNQDAPSLQAIFLSGAGSRCGKCWAGHRRRQTRDTPTRQRPSSANS